MAGPCLGVLGWAVGRQVQRRPAFRQWSENCMTAEELLDEILKVLKDIQRMQAATYKAQIGATIDMFPSMPPIPEPVDLPIAN